jgi:hypothetical protein
MAVRAASISNPVSVMARRPSAHFRTAGGAGLVDPVVEAAALERVVQVAVDQSASPPIRDGPVSSRSA